MRLEFGNDQNNAAWIVQHIPHMRGGRFVEPYTTILVVDSDGRPAAGVLFNQYTPGIAIEASMAAVTPQWATRNIIRAILSYPFLQLEVNKVYTVVPHTNVRTLRFLKGIGFVQEAVLAQHFGHQPKVHAVISRLFRHEYMRRYWPQEQRHHGQVSSQSAYAA